MCSKPCSSLDDLHGAERSTCRSLCQASSSLLFRRRRRFCPWKGAKLPLHLEAAAVNAEKERQTMEQVSMRFSFDIHLPMQMHSNCVYIGIHEYKYQCIQLYSEYSITFSFIRAICHNFLTKISKSKTVRAAISSISSGAGGTCTQCFRQRLNRGATALRLWLRCHKRQLRRVFL